MTCGILHITPRSHHSFLAFVFVKSLALEIVACAWNLNLQRSVSKVGFSGSRSAHDEALRLSLNMLTKAIGKCVVKTDSSRGMALGRSQFSAIKALDSLHLNRPALSLDYLRIVFSVDNRGILWFSHVEDLKLRELTTKVITADGERCDKSIIAASHLVASEFQRLLNGATRAGVSLEQCFGHFDSSRSG